MSVIDDIIQERERQKTIEGWTEENDDKYQNDELLLSAACYALAPVKQAAAIRVASLDTLETYAGPDAWPFDESWDKRKIHSSRRSLIIAASLIVAEVERRDRVAQEANCD